MGLIDRLRATFGFKDTIFYKYKSDLQAKYEALSRLNKEYPNNEEILEKLYMVEKGLEGENEIAYQLKKSHIGMYVLRDIRVKYGDLNAQIDYVIITPVFTYYVECKNLVGNITVNEKGDFIREFEINNKKIKKGMTSPLRQVEAQREVIRKIWEDNTSSFHKLFASSKFDYFRRVLVVVSNKDTILDTSRAPRSMKYKIIRVDALVRQIEYEIAHRSRSDYYNSKKDMKNIAQAYLDLTIEYDIDYYKHFKSKLCKNMVSNKDLKDKLIEFRTARSKEKKIPPYYVFNNDELDKIVELKPKNKEELNSILPDIKVKTHGDKIIEIINN